MNDRRASASSTVTVTVPPENILPTADLSACPTTGGASLKVDFNGKCEDPDGTITECKIDFKDGPSSAFTSGMTHTYSKTGDYYPVLTATDNMGATSSSTTRVVVAQNQLPRATLTATMPTSGEAPFKTTFSAGCSDTDGTITGCSLDFGDGTVVDAKAPSSGLGCGGAGTASVISSQSFSHSYKGGVKEGVVTFTARLTATDDSDAVVTSDSITISVSTSAVLAKVSAAPEVNVKGVRNKITVNFTTQKEMPAGGKIRIVFPTGFDLSKRSGSYCTLPNGAYKDYFTSSSADGNTVEVSNSGTNVPPSDFSCVISGVKNPSISPTGSIPVSTVDPSGHVIEKGTAPGNLLGGQGIISGVKVVRSSWIPDKSIEVLLTFTTSNTIPSDGTIRFTLPSGFDVNGASADCTDMDGGVRVSAASPVIQISRSGDGSALPPRAMACTLRNVKNPSTRGYADIFTVQTTDKLD